MRYFSIVPVSLSDWVIRSTVCCISWIHLYIYLSHRYAQCKTVEPKRNQVNKYSLAWFFKYYAIYPTCHRFPIENIKRNLFILSGFCSVQIEFQSEILITSSSRLRKKRESETETELYLYVLKSFPRAQAPPLKALILFIAAGICLKFRTYSILYKVWLWLVKIMKFHEKRP